MGDRLISTYHMLPAPVRTLAASWRGLTLRNWRYGPESEYLVEQALERDHWSADQWRRWTGERLLFILCRAATRVPFYRNYWEDRRRHGDKSSWEELSNWPILDKQTLRTQPKAFVAEDCIPERMFCDRTSGTSGTPLVVYNSRDTVRHWYALVEARMRRWHGVSWRSPWAILGGQPVVSPSATTPPFWVWNAPMHQLYLSANHVSVEHARHFAQALAERGVEHLITYPSSAAALARCFFEAGIVPHGIRVVLGNAEPLTPQQREIIARGFASVVRETYGMAETVAAASECPEGQLHFWPEAGWVEVLKDQENQAAAPGETGRLVCTSLLNPDMPLVRYAVGDRAALPATASTCACGRMLPRFGPVEGRTNDMLVAPDGRFVYWLNPAFYGLPVREAQIIQESPERIRVLVVPDQGFTEVHADVICQRINARMGQVQTSITRCDRIPRGPNGKFQAVVSHIAPSAPHPTSS